VPALTHPLPPACLPHASLPSLLPATGSTLNHWPFPWKHLPEAYCYLLTHCGTPCVFYDHFYFDEGGWGLGGSLVDWLVGWLAGLLAGWQGGTVGEQASDAVPGYLLPAPPLMLHLTCERLVSPTCACCACCATSDLACHAVPCHATPRCAAGLRKHILELLKIRKRFGIHAKSEVGACWCFCLVAGAACELWQYRRHSPCLRHSVPCLRCPLVSSPPPQTAPRPPAALCPLFGCCCSQVAVRKAYGEMYAAVIDKKIAMKIGPADWRWVPAGHSVLCCRYRAWQAGCSLQRTLLLGCWE